MKSKKLLSCMALLLTTVMLLLLCGCSGNEDKSVSVETKGELEYIDLTYTTAYDSDENNEEVITVPWGASLFSHDPEQLNWDLLLLSAGMTACITDGGDHDPHFSEGHYITGALKKLGFTDIALFSYPKSRYNVSKDDAGFGSEDDTFAFAIGHRVMEDENGSFDLITIVMRGTVTFDEMIADSLFTYKTRSWVDGYTTYDGFYGFANDVLKGLDYVKNKYSSSFTGDRTVYLISGHSLGGAAANLTAARLTSDGETVYGFTFGALNSLTRSANSIYKNIWNCMNYYDAFGPHGGEFFKPASGDTTFSNKYGKVGVNKTKYAFSTGDTRFDNHDMKPYFLGAEGRLFNFDVVPATEAKEDPATTSQDDDDGYDDYEDYEEYDYDDISFLIGDWSTSDGVLLSFYDDGYFEMEWGYFPAEEGEWYAEAISDDTYYIEMDGSLILSLMSMVYGSADSDYHFEILKNNENSFYLVQVYGNYTAETSPCKLGFTRY